jgi:hypothetical protein
MVPTPRTPSLINARRRRAVLMAALADQTSLPWADEFPRKIERAKKSEEDN